MEGSSAEAAASLCGKRADLGWKMCAGCHGAMARDESSTHGDEGANGLVGTRQTSRLDEQRVAARRRGSIVVQVRLHQQISGRQIERALAQAPSPSPSAADVIPSLQPHPADTEFIFIRSASTGPCDAIQESWVQFIRMFVTPLKAYLSSIQALPRYSGH